MSRKRIVRDGIVAELADDGEVDTFEDHPWTDAWIDYEESDYERSMRGWGV